MKKTIFLAFLFAVTIAYSNDYSVSPIPTSLKKTTSSLNATLLSNKSNSFKQSIIVKSKTTNFDCGTYSFTVNYACGYVLSGTITLDCSVSLDQAIQNAAVQTYETYLGGQAPGCNQTPFPEFTYTHS